MFNSPFTEPIFWPSLKQGNWVWCAASTRILSVRAYKFLVSTIRNTQSKRINCLFFISSNHAGTFDLLAYTDADGEVPTAWEDGDEHYISNAEEVKLKSFSTLLHKVDMAVCYKVS